jgi:hypothetical protein
MNTKNLLLLLSIICFLFILECLLLPPKSAVQQAEQTCLIQQQHNLKVL